MPIARFQMPDGRIARFEVPAGTTPEQAQTMMVAHFSQPEAIPAPAAAPEPGAAEYVSATATGLNRGAFTKFAGAPVDTVLNVIDLAKAGVGTAYQAASGNTAPDFLLPTARADKVGSSDWIENQVRNAGGASLVDPSGPQNATTRVLHSMGMGAGGAVAGGRISGLPMSGLVQARVAAGGAASGTAGQVATENGASPATSVLFSMSPQAARAGLVAGTKFAVRGGERGRQDMEQRLFELREAGIENPSLGLTSGNAFIAGLENLASKVPGSVGLFANHRQRALDGMEAKSASARDQASTRYGSDVAGAAIQADLRTGLKPRIESGYDRVNDRMVQQVPAGQRFPIPNSLAALDAATATNPLAPATTGSFVQPRIAALRQNILADTMDTMHSTYGGQTINKGMPVSATRAIRTSIGKEAASRAISGTPEQAEFKQIYRGLSEDIRLAAQQADAAQGPQPNNRGPAERSFDRGNDLYRAGMDRIKTVQPFASKDAPEQAYNALMQSGKENVSTMRAVKKSVSEDTRATVAATTIDRMGKAKPGQQNDTGDVWSPETFLTNWNQLTPKARAELTSGFKGAEKVRAQVEAIAKGASMMRDSSRVWANPSGTGGNTLAAGTVGGIAGTMFVNPLAAAGAVGGLGVVNIGSRSLLLNPKFTEAMAKPRGQYNALLDLVPLTMNADQARRER